MLPVGLLYRVLALIEIAGCTGAAVVEPLLMQRIYEEYARYGNGIKQPPDGSAERIRINTTGCCCSGLTEAVDYLSGTVQQRTLHP